MHASHTHTSKKRGFTLLELLIVITILAILSLVVVLFINPVEMLKKSRDTQRMSDLATLNAAVSLFLQDKTSNTLGGSTYCTSSTNPTSISDTLGGLTGIKTSLPPASGAAAPYDLTFTTGTAKYNATSTPDLANGQGWIKGINFGSVSSGAPISKLPIDPVNTGNTGTTGTGTVGIDSLYYRFGCRTNNTFEIDATLESSAWGPTSTSDNKAAKDGGGVVMRYEVGTDLTILPSTAPIL